jgi:hypothetical protein
MGDRGRGPGVFVDSCGQKGLTVHTRDGAVVEGTIQGDNVLLDVPGVGKLLFVRGK